jgi:flagellar biosynthesis GTPase FlhF
MKPMRLNKIQLLVTCLILSCTYTTSLQAVTNAELEALEKLIEQQELEEKNKLEERHTEETRKKEAEVQRIKKEQERQRLEEEQRLLEVEKGKLEQEKRKLEDARQAEADRKKQEEEAKQFALEDQKRKEEEAANARVSVVFYRAASYVGSLTTVPLKHNENHIGTLPNGSFLILSSQPGSQSFSTDSGYPSYDVIKTIDFEPGKIYYLQLGVGFSFSIALISQAEGRNAIKGLKNVGKINPADVLIDYDESEAYKEKDTSIQYPSL